MLASRYNFWSTTEKGDPLLFNGRTGALIRLEDATEKDSIEKTLSTGIGYGSETLITNGMLIPDDCDEINILLNSRKKPTTILEITVSPTYDCNFRCEYCYVNFDRSVMSKHVIECVIDDIVKCGSNFDTVNITWFGGEPLLNVDILVHMMNSINAGLENTNVNHFITSNGYLLSRDNVDALYGAGARFFHITIDGSREQHDNHRFLIGGAPSYDTIMKNFLELFRLEDISCVLRMNLDMDSLSTAIDTLKSIPEKYRRRIQFHPTPIIRDGFDQPRELYNGIAQLISDSLDMGYQYYRDIIMTGKRYHCIAEDPNSFQYGPLGLKYKCSPSYKPEVTVGNVLGLKCDDQIRNQKAWDDNEQPSDKCRDCHYFCFCMGGCRLNRIRNTIPDNCTIEYSSVSKHIQNYWKYLNYID